MGYGGPLKNLPPQMRWGRENKVKARKCYIEDRQAAGEMMTVAPSGLHLMPEKAYLGASSDGLVICSNVNGQVVVDCIFPDLEYWNQLEETLGTFCYSRDIIWRNIPGRVWFIFVACLL